MRKVSKTVVKLEREIKACENIINAQREQIDKKIKETEIQNKDKEQTKANIGIEQRIEGIKLKINEILNKITVPDTKDNM